MVTSSVLCGVQSRTFNGVRERNIQQTYSWFYPVAFFSSSLTIAPLQKRINSPEPFSTLSLLQDSISPLPLDRTESAPALVLECGQGETA